MTETISEEPLKSSRLHIYLSSNLWDGLWIIQQPIANEIGKRETVLYVERTVSVFTVLRYPRLWRRLFAWMRGCRPTSGRVQILAPLPLFHLGHRFPRLFALELRIQRWWIERHARGLGADKRVLWLDNPVFAAAIPLFRSDIVVYHLADEMSAFDTSSVEIMQELERRVLQRADIVFAAAEQLSLDKRRVAPRVVTVWNAIATELFERPAQKAIVLERIPAPRIAFVGVIDSWVDIELLTYAAESVPEASFVVIGPTLTKDLAGLRRLPNVHFLGQRPRSEIPDLLRHCSASVIPFRRNPLTQRIVPLKVFEALAAGIVPIASDFSPDLSILAAEGQLKLADTREAFRDHVRAAIAEDTPARRAALREFGLRQNWTERWSSMDAELRAVETEKAATPASYEVGVPGANIPSSPLANAGSHR